MLLPTKETIILGLFITRNRAVLLSLHFGIHTMHGE